MTADLNDLSDKDDSFTLLRILRRDSDPRRRTAAARQIPSLDNLDMVEGLIRAYLADNDAQVKEAALKALEDILGKNEASMAIRTYGPVDNILEYEEFVAEIDPYQEEMINQNELDLEFLDFSHSPGGHVAEWEPPQNGALIMFLEDDTHPDRQLKVIPIIGANLTPEGIDALCMATLWSQNVEVSQAARKELENHFGDETTKLLEDFQKDRSGDSSDEEVVSEEIDSDEDDHLTPVKYTSDLSSPSFKEPHLEGTQGWVLILLILLLSAAAIIYWFYLR